MAILATAVTDNTNRTVSEVRRTLERHGGNLGRDGSVAWNFERMGQIVIDAGRYDEEVALEAALDSGAEDLQTEGEVYVVTTDPSSFHTVREALRAKGIEIVEGRLVMLPKTTVRVEGRDAERLVSLLEALEDLDDVQHVYSNLDIDDALLAELAGAGR